MVQTPSMSRRTMMMAAAGTLAGRLLAPSSGSARQNTASERDPRVAGMAPSTVGASESFKAARGADVALNTQSQTEPEVQNRFDLAVLEMFNVMKTNEFRLATGEMATYITAGNVPVGTDTAAFAEELASAQDEYAITAMHYPESAVDRSGGEWGVFDAKKGLGIRFVEEPGLFDVTVGVDGQIYGFTPRLAADRTLLLDVYTAPADPRSNPSIQYPEVAEDVAYTWVASNMMQLMMVSYGATTVFDPVRDPFNTAVRALMDQLFLPPYAVNRTIASLLLNKSKESGSFVDYADTSLTSLLDYRPL